MFQLIPQTNADGSEPEKPLADRDGNQLKSPPPVRTPVYLKRVSTAEGEKLVLDQNSIPINVPTSFIPMPPDAGDSLRQSSPRDATSEDEEREKIGGKMEKRVEEEKKIEESGKMEKGEKIGEKVEERGMIGKEGGERAEGKGKKNSRSSKPLAILRLIRDALLYVPCHIFDWLCRIFAHLRHGKKT
ncbi:MAG: hypothetical protein LBT98_03680 [Puniceicoccales bacterium]|jgi:hypothetical protein|nr:hypothetical protein [Puniceicoccales bacterium]